MYRLEIEFDCTSSRICLTECLSSQPSYVLLPGLAVWRWITSCFGNICVLNTSKDIARIGVWTLLLPWHHWDWNNGNWSKYLFPLLLVNLLQVSSKITIMVNIYIICYRHAQYISLLLKCFAWSALSDSAAVPSMIRISLGSFWDWAQAETAGKGEVFSCNLRIWYMLTPDVKTVWVNQSRGLVIDYMYRGLCELLYLFSDPCSILCNLFFFYKNWYLRSWQFAWDYELSFIHWVFHKYIACL